MSTNTHSLALPPQQEESLLKQTRFPLGHYEFCEPDYRQILLWAEALASEPIEVLRRLEDSKSRFHDLPCTFKVENGAIVSLV